MATLFTKEHIAALDKAIAEKRANPAMQFITDGIQIINDAAPVNLVDTVGAVAAMVGAEARPADPSTLAGNIPEGGLSLEQLIKARDHALANL